MRTLRLARLVILGLLVPATATACSASSNPMLVPNEAKSAIVADGWVALDNPLPMPTPGDLSKLLPSSNATYVVNIWATWCGPCRDELPLLQKASAQRSVDIVGVSMDTDPGTSVDFMIEVGAVFPNYADPRGEVASALGEQFRLPGYPVSLAVQGKTVYAIHVGAFEKVAQVERASSYVKD